MITFMEQAIKDKLKRIIVGLEDDYWKPPKLMMIHVLNKEQPREPVKE